MFLSFRRQSAKCRKILLSSVGDHLSKDDEQDILRADLFVDVEILKETAPNNEKWVWFDNKKRK